MSWPMVALGDVADMCLGKMLDAAKNKGTPFFYLRNPNVRWFKVDTSDLKQMPFEAHELDRYGLIPGDVVICEGGEAGRAAIWEGQVADVKFQKAIHRVRVGEKLHNRYLVHRLKHDYDSGHLSDYHTGATIKHLTGQDLARYRIPLPPLPEQRRIAAILDKADALRAKRREAIAKLDQLLQSVFFDMFGDPVTNPKGWPKAALAELFEIARGGSPRPIDAYITDDPRGINWIMIGDTTEGSKYITATRKRIKPEGAKRSRLVKPGDFLLTNSMSFGRPYIMKTHGCIHDGWLVLSPKDSRTEHDFLFSALASPSIYSEFARRAPGATVKNLNIDLVSGVEIIVPPIDLQSSYSRVIARIEAEESKQQVALNASDKLFGAIQSEAFSGNL